MEMLNDNEYRVFSMKIIPMVIGVLVSLENLWIDLENKCNGCVDNKEYAKLLNSEGLIPIARHTINTIENLNNLSHCYNISTKEILTFVNMLKNAPTPPQDSTTRDISNCICALKCIKDQYDSFGTTNLLSVIYYELNVAKNLIDKCLDKNCYLW